MSKDNQKNIQKVIQKFVNKHYKDLIVDLMDDLDKILTTDLIESEEFKIWFNEDWVADKWINHVDTIIYTMTDKEKTNLLVKDGLDNVFNMCRMIGTFEDPDNFTVDKLVWHVIDHWYTFDMVVNKFYEKIKDKNIVKF
jgi:hypothetical protein